MKNIVLAISGPSGVGKGTLVNLLLERNGDIGLSVSCTTRSPRPGEEDGVAYFFLSKEEFLRRIEEGDFLEYDEHFGNYYGTPKSYVLQTLEHKSVILEIDVHGVAKAKESLPQTVTLFVAPPSKEELIARLKNRASEGEEEIAERVARMEYEFEQAKDYDYVVVNDDLERAYAEIMAIIEKEKNSVEQGDKK